MTLCRFVQLACTTLLQLAATWLQVIQCIMQQFLHDIVRYFQPHSGHSLFLVVSLITLPYLCTLPSVLLFPLSGKLLQTVKLLTCVRGTSSSWTTAFQPKDSKLHRECKYSDRLWHVQYCFYTRYCCCSNLYARITEHDNDQLHWMKEMSWLHQQWSVQQQDRWGSQAVSHVVSSYLVQTNNNMSKQ